MVALVHDPANPNRGLPEGCHEADQLFAEGKTELAFEEYRALEQGLSSGSLPHTQIRIRAARALRVLGKHRQSVEILNQLDNEQLDSLDPTTRLSNRRDLELLKAYIEGSLIADFNALSDKFRIRTMNVTSPYCRCDMLEHYSLNVSLMMECPERVHPQQLSPLLRDCEALFKNIRTDLSENSRHFQEARGHILLVRAAKSFFDEESAKAQKLTDGAIQIFSGIYGENHPEVVLMRYRFQYHLQVGELNKNLFKLTEEHLPLVRFRLLLDQTDSLLNSCAALVGGMQHIRETHRSKIPLSVIKKEFERYNFGQYLPFHGSKMVKPKMYSRLLRAAIVITRKKALELCSRAISQLSKCDDTPRVTEERETLKQRVEAIELGFSKIIKEAA